MNNQDFIQFKKKRDLGAMLSDTSKFLSTEWKPFFTTILKHSLIPILIAIGAMIYYVMSLTGFVGSIAQTNPEDVFSSMNTAKLFVPILAFFLSYIVAYALIMVSGMSYIKSYISNKGIVNFEDVNTATKNKFWSFIGLLFLNGIIVFIGALFCFLPGIYFGVVLSLSTCLLIFQNKSVGDSVSDSFSFIKEHWWETFGILLVVFIINWILSTIVSLPASLYQSTDMASILQSQDPDIVLESFSDPIYLALLVFSYFVNFILYIISTIVTVFIYFDIKEQKNPSVDIINEIGVE